MSWYPDLPHDEAGGHGGVRSLTTICVIHCTDNTASDEAEAHYAEHRQDGTSAHFYSDDDSVTQALDTDVVAYGCYPTGNSRSVQFELTGLSNRISDAAMRRVAPIVARVCAQYGLPVRHVGPGELSAGAEGICGHGDVTRAWGEGDHTDPGDQFPWTTFISYVAAGGGEEDDMSERSDQILAAYAAGLPKLGDGTPVSPVVWRIRDEAWQASITASLARDEARDAAMAAVISSMAAAIKAGGGSVDAVAITAVVRDATQAVGDRVIAALQAQAARGAAAAQAEADALKG